MALSSSIFCDACGAANRAQAVFCTACGRRLGTPAFSNGSVSSTLTGLLTHRHVLKQRYMILSQVGRGGFGAVYKATDTQFGNRLVAVKEMSQSNLSPQELVKATEAFKREALLLAVLTHPNLPRIYEQFTDTGRSYLVMDFIEGETLEHHLNSSGGKKLPIEKVLDTGIQLCSVLDYLHTRQPPIIFRDLKPANVMLTATGHIYLIDFGIARHFKPGQTRDTAALGSSGYAAPEQYGKSQTTARADIYALGATLHQLLTGDDPSESPFHFAPLQLQHQPAGLDTLVTSMVSVDITRRPASVADVKRELQRLATLHATRQLSPLQYGSPNAYQAPKLQQPQQSSSKGTRKPKQVALPQLPSYPNILYVCYGHSSRVTAVVWSPDGKRLASASYDKTVQLWDAANGGNILTYKGHLGRVNALAWSPDSKRLVSASDDGTVQVWDAATGSPIFPYHDHSGKVNAIAWSPDGLRIASAGDDKTVKVWGVNTGTHFTYQGHTDKVHTVVWSPDGKRIASAGEDRKIQIWEPTKDQQKRSFLSSFLSPNRGRLTLAGHYGRINGLAWSPDGRYLASASSDQRVLVWDALTGKTISSYGVTTPGMKNSVAWSPKGNHLASGSNDKTVEVWNIATKRLTFTYRGHVGYVMAVAWSPDGTRIASAGVDRTVQVWQAV